MEDLYEWDNAIEEIVTDLKDVTEELNDIWTECGYDEKQQTNRRRAFRKHVCSLLFDMLNEERVTKSRHEETVKSYKASLNTMCKELGMLPPCFDDLEGQTLVKCEQELLKRISDYKKIIETRMEKYDCLQNQEREICRRLGRDVRKTDSLILTDAFFQEFEHYVQTLKAEKTKLELTFIKTRGSILVLVKNLEWIPSLQFEKTVICGEDAEFILSKENMDKLQKLHDSLNKEWEDRTAHVEELHEKLTCLWNRLNVDNDYRKKFLEQNKGYTQSTITSLKEEIKHREHEKKQNIRRFVETIRAELQDWWDKCFFNQEQRQKFAYFNSDCYTEDLLELHEMEVRKLSEFYNNNVNIFELYAKHKELWEKMLVLENKASDPNRLFVNRGGQLLQEEKERKFIMKQLPKIEEEISKYVTEYEKENGLPFLINGVRFSDMINEQWEKLRNEKEKERNARKIARDQQTEMESKLGSKSLTKNQSLKRKNQRCVTPTHTANKNPRVVTSEKKPLVCNSNPRPRPREDPGCIRQVKRNIFRRSKSASDLRGAKENFVKPGLSEDMIPQPQDNTLASSIVSYTDFQEHLERRNIDEICRSSVMPSKLCNVAQKNQTPLKPPRRNVTPHTQPRSLIRPKTPMAKSPSAAKVQPIMKHADTKRKMYFL